MRLAEPFQPPGPPTRARFRWNRKRALSFLFIVRLYRKTASHFSGRTLAKAATRPGSKREQPRKRRPFAVPHAPSPFCSFGVCRALTHRARNRIGPARIRVAGCSPAVAARLCWHLFKRNSEGI